VSGREPRVANIPPGASFADALARGLLARWDGDPLKLSRATVLLPTRRACRTLGEAFLRASGGRPLLLPRLVPLGDIDADELILSGEEGLLGEGLGSELPPAMPALRRQLLLSRLILAWASAEKASGGVQAPSEDQAARLAAELGRLLDQVETEGLDFSGLAELVPEDYAAHWQTTLRFLSILTEQWPAVQAAEGCIGPAERRRLLLEAQAEAWRRNPPADPVIVAGSTGSIPAAAALIAVVARLPQGQVVLPGFDRGADDETWSAVRAEPSHPQHGLAVLLERLGVAREAVADWPDIDPPATSVTRADFVNLALRPAEQSSEWRAAVGVPGRPDLEATLAGVRRIDCSGPGEEATVIALLLRQALTVPGRRAALVTPDRGLARRVASELRRWNVEVDDSAGLPLGETPPGTFLRLTAEMVAARLAPLPLLAALKHPLAAGGLSEGAFRARVRTLERVVLRGPRPAPGFAGLLAGLQAQDADRGLIGWVEGLAETAAPLVQALERPDAGLAEVVDTHVALAESLAANDLLSGADRLWAQEAGEAAAGFVTELREAAAGAPAFPGERYPALLAGLMAGQVVRPRYGAHPRLAILGPLEARLQHADLVVLAGLNEGTWPAEVDTGPWLSRPMRADFGLPAPERRTGLAAHDFTQAFSAPEVFLTRATRVEGTPSVPSRWLLRIDALLAALDLQAIHDEAWWPDWAAALDRPAEIRPGVPPEPRPPVAARPRRLPVTRIETWMRDPYALYAREVLRLKPLDPIDADPGAADRGILVHKALERFLKAHPRVLPEDPAASLLAEGERVFEEIRAKPGVWAFWWPRFRRIARWFAEAEGLRRAQTVRAWSEVPGRLELAGPAGPFELTAKADRIDLGHDGRLAILDYKTGALPPQKEIELGFAPQLPLEAAIAAAGGFGPKLPAGAPASLGFWRLTGGEPPGEAKAVKGEPGELAAQALAGLSRLVALFDRPETPYPVMPWPGREPRYNDYAHLARVKEWSAGASGEEEL
jgi:ATP-dependent helicase/nuclease subunit B